MKITGVTVLGLVASAQAFHVPVQTNVAARGSTSGRSSTTVVNAAISDAEVRNLPIDRLESPPVYGPRLHLQLQGGYPRTAV